MYKVKDKSINEDFASNGKRTFGCGVTVVEDILRCNFVRLFEMRLPDCKCLKMNSERISPYCPLCTGCTDLDKLLPLLFDLDSTLNLLPRLPPFSRCLLNLRFQDFNLISKKSKLFEI